MAKPYTAAMPPDTEYDNGCTITFTAIDPTNGNTITGVTVSDVSIYFDDTGGIGDFAVGPWQLVAGPGA